MGDHRINGLSTPDNRHDRARPFSVISWGPDSIAKYYSAVEKYIKGNDDSYVEVEDYKATRKPLMVMSANIPNLERHGIDEEDGRPNVFIVGDPISALAVNGDVDKEALTRPIQRHVRIDSSINKTAFRCHARHSSSVDITVTRKQAKRRSTIQGPTISASITTEINHKEFYKNLKIKSGLLSPNSRFEASQEKGIFGAQRIDSPTDNLAKSYMRRDDALVPGESLYRLHSEAPKLPSVPLTLATITNGIGSRSGTWPVCGIDNNDASVNSRPLPDVVQDDFIVHYPSQTLGFSNAIGKDSQAKKFASSHASGIDLGDSQDFDRTAGFTSVFDHSSRKDTPVDNYNLVQFSGTSIDGTMIGSGITEQPHAHHIAFTSRNSSAFSGPVIREQPTSKHQKMVYSSTNEIELRSREERQYEIYEGLEDGATVGGFWSNFWNVCGQWTGSGAVGWKKWKVGGL